MHNPWILEGGEGGGSGVEREKEDICNTFNNKDDL